MHEHAHGHAGANLRRLGVVLALNVGIVAVEVVGARLTGSLALYADAAHNLTDVGAVALAFFAARLAIASPTSRRTFGSSRAEILAALANGILLVVLSVAILFAAFARLASPPSVAAGGAAGFGLVALAANALGAALLYGERANLNVRAAFLHLVADVLSSGIVVVASLAVLAFANPLADVAASVLIGLLLIVSSWGVVRESVDVLLQATPSGMESERIRACVSELPGVADVHDVHVWTLASGRYVATIHVVVPEEAMVRVDDIVCGAQERLAAEFGIEHTTVQVETTSMRHVGAVHE